MSRYITCDNTSQPRTYIVPFFRSVSNFPTGPCFRGAGHPALPKTDSDACRKTIQDTSRPASTLPHVHVGGLTADTVTTRVAAYLRWNTHKTELVVPTKSHQCHQVLLHILLSEDDDRLKNYSLPPYNCRDNLNYKVKL